MQEQLLQFNICKVWYLVPELAHANIIGTKRIYRNKTDENGNIIRTKAFSSKLHMSILYSLFTYVLIEDWT